MYALIVLNISLNVQVFFFRATTIIASGMSVGKDETKETN